MTRAPTSDRWNPRIEGLRGLCALMVVVGHFVPNLLLPDIPFSGALASQSLVLSGKILLVMASSTLSGVAVDLFFILSGFLITNLLIDEDSKNGRIAFGAFYLRRFFRIAPSLIALVLVAGLLADRGAFTLSERERLMAVTFQCNLPWAGCTWWLGHSWSVAVEQQFYLLWPISFMVLGRRRRASGSLLFAVVIAITSMFSPRVDAVSCLAAGVALACNPPLRQWMSRFLCSEMHVVLAIGLAMAPSLMKHWAVLDALLLLVEPFALAIILVATVDGRGTIARLTSSKTMQRFGAISYSLYLWQQLFVGRPDYYLQSFSAAWIALMIPCTVACHLLVEKPFIAVGRFLAASLTRRTRVKDVARGEGLEVARKTPGDRRDASAAALRETIVG